MVLKFHYFKWKLDFFFLSLLFLRYAMPKGTKIAFLFFRTALCDLRLKRTHMQTNATLQSFKAAQFSFNVKKKKL